MDENIVRLGNAVVTCDCGKKIKTNDTAKYMYELITRLQAGNVAVIRSSYQKLETVEAILGLLFPLHVRELRRSVIKDNNVEFVDVFVSVS